MPWGSSRGNCNFEGRIDLHNRANYLASPLLCVAYALAGTVKIDFNTEPLGVLQWHRVFVSESCYIHVYISAVHFVNLLNFEIALLHELKRLNCKPILKWESVLEVTQHSFEISV